MYVAHFIQRYPPALGGSEAYFARLGDYLTRQGDEVTVWTTTALELNEFWKQNTSPRTAVHGLVRRYRSLVFPARRYILKALSLLPVRPWQCLTIPCNPLCPGMWRDAGRYHGPLDAVHASAFPYAFPIRCGLRLARRRRVPFYLTPFLHLGDPTHPNDRTRKQYTAPHLRWLLRQADGVFVQTKLERDAIRDLGVQPDRIVLQGLGVDPAECTGGNRTETREAWAIGPKEVVIGHLANASVEKGTVDLLQASDRAWAAGHRFQLVLAGPEMPNFKAFWASRGDQPHGSSNRVIRLGVLSEPQKRDFFAGIDAFALPSRSDSFGLVLLEAWTNGKPNLVYRAGGPAELVRDGIDGLHARCGDVAELTAQLVLLVKNAKLREQLGENGRSRIESEFQWEQKLEIVRSTIVKNVIRGAEPSERNAPISSLLVRRTRVHRSAAVPG
jgi:glycosyltransferase involved in cell wall biosynthesis